MMKWGRSLLATLAIALGLLLAPLPAQARGAAAALVSPDHAQTWPWAELEHYNWTLDHGTILTLVLTYSNRELADRDDPPQTEDLWFRFPMVHFDPATGNFLYTVKGHSVVVARRANGFVKTTELTPHALAVVVRSAGALQAALAIDPSHRPPGHSMVEIVRPGPYTLQSLIGETVEFH